MEKIGLTKSGRELYTAPSDEILVEEGRIRKTFNPKTLTELKLSIKDKGQLQAGICRLNPEGRVVLIAGERRLRACQELNRPYEFVLTTETDPRRIREIELEENIKRDELTWQEKVDAVEEYHNLQQDFNPPPVGKVTGGQTVEDTADLLGKSKSLVADDLELAAFMQLDEVRNAPNKTEAKKIVKRIKEDYFRAKALKEAQALNLTKEGQEEVAKDTLSVEEKSKAALLEKINFFAPKVLEGKMEEHLSSFPNETFNIVLFDPPWGQDVDSVNEITGDKEVFDDSPEVFFTGLERWLNLLYQKMAPNSHLYMFFGIKEHSFVYDTLEKVGFAVNRMPIIWNKMGAHKVRTPKIWPGRSYEAIAFARKGSKDLLWLGAPDFVTTPAPTGAMKGSHLTGKHPDVYINLLKRSAFPGDKVLDPMAGTGMSGIACEALRPTHQLDWTLIEEKPEFVRLAIANLIKGYSNIVLVGAATEGAIETPFWYCSCGGYGVAEDLVYSPGSATRCFCPKCGEAAKGSKVEIPSSYKEINLQDDEGKHLWLVYWRIHPEQQEEMLAWKKKGAL